MEIRPLAELKCVLLHPDHAPVDRRLLQEAAASLMRQLGVEEDPAPLSGDTERDLHVAYGDWQVMIQQLSEPLPWGAFRNLRQNVYTQMVFPQLDNAITAHASYTVISIGKGTVPFLEELVELVARFVRPLGEMMSMTTLAEVNAATQVAAELARFIIGHRPILGLFWSVSNQMLPPRMAVDYLGMENRLVLLNISPQFYSEAGPLGPGQPLGALFVGSPHLIGRLVDLKESPLPPATVALIGHAFVQMTLESGELIPHGHTFGPPDDSWRVAVWHEARDRRMGVETIRLEVIHAPAHGIVRQGGARGLADAGGHGDAAHGLLGSLFQRLRTA